MSDAAFILLGLILSLSLLLEFIARRTRLSRISLLVLLGVAAAVIHQLVLGQDATRPLGALREPLINLALVMVAFLLGGELTLERLRRLGPLIVILSLAVMGVGAAVVGFGLVLMGYPLVVAAALAAISMATDPAAVVETIEEVGDDSLKARLLKGIVGIDDAWGIIGFGLAMALLGWLESGEGLRGVLPALWELGGAGLVGLSIGLGGAWLTGRVEAGRPTQVEALALVLLMTGLAEWLEVSALLTAMIAGALIVNLSAHHDRTFNEIEGIKWPFLVFFFVLSGASIDLAVVQSGLVLVGAYFILRLGGRYLGGWVGVRVRTTRSAELPSNIGLSLTPQAGVAMGMALLASERFPEHGALIMAATVGSTIVFELVGPLLVRRVLYAQ